MKKPKNGKEWQAELDHYYKIIGQIAIAEGNSDWLGAVVILKRLVITKPPWWWEKTKLCLWNWKYWRYIKKNNLPFKWEWRDKTTINATTVLPPMFADTIFLYDRYWEKQNLESRVSILIHEWKHWHQHQLGDLDYIKYVTSSEYRKKVEAEAEAEEQAFRMAFRKHYKGELA